MSAKGADKMPKHGKRVAHISIDDRDPTTVRAVILARVSDPNAKDITVESQTDACKDFITTMRWQHIGTYSDKRSGIFNVVREALDEVERLIQQHAVDVVVVLNWERLARREIQRNAALYHAEKFGCEYRFVEFKPDGKLPDTQEFKALAAVRSLYGELNRAMIVANTSRGREKRAAQGTPSGGSDGPPYGMRDATPADLPLNRFAREDAEAKRLLWMFQRIDEDERVSARSLARELNTRGWLTRRGYQWTNKTVLDKLTNPRYCGRGRLNRWEVTRTPKIDEYTGRRDDVRVVKKRVPIVPPETGETTENTESDGTLPIAPNSEPVLIPPDLFDRVQAKLKERGRRAGALGRIGSPHPADATLLHGGIVLCGDCKNGMARFWRRDTTRYAADPVPYYRCSMRLRDPSHPCALHAIPARKVDALVLRLLAFALTDPEQVIALADATAQRHAAAMATAEIAATKLEGYAERLPQIADERTRLVKRMQLCDPHNPDDAEDIARYRERIARLDQEQDDIEAEMARLGPVRVHADERAAFLRRLFTVRTHYFNFATSKRGEHGDPHLHIGSQLPLHQAAALLGVAESELDLPITRGDWFDYTTDDGTTVHEQIADSIDTADVLYSLLQRTPHSRLRRLLKDLGAVVEIARPRSKADRQRLGRRPVEDRVTLVVGDLRLRSASATNGTPLV
jgi:DNA invertase Pin-like site-specific DNA recombinase